jgi:hypothetical protein
MRARSAALKVIIGSVLLFTRAHGKRVGFAVGVAISALSRIEDSAVPASMGRAGDLAARNR